MRSTTYWRIALYRTLMAVFVIALILSVVSVWANVRVQETDAWTQTVAPLADNADVRAYIVEQTSGLIDRQLAVDSSAGRVERATRTQVSLLAHALLNDFVMSDSFAGWWTDTNAAAHTMLVDAVANEDGVVIRARDDAFVLDLQPVVAWTNERLATLLPGVSYTIELPEDQDEIVLYSSGAIPQALSIINIVDTLALVLPAIAFTALAATLAFAPNWLTSIRSIGLLVAVGMVAALIALASLRLWVVGRQPETSRDALDAIIRIVAVDLMAAIRTFVVAGLVIAAFAALVQYRASVWGFARQHPTVLVAAGLAVGAIVLIIPRDPTRMVLIVGGAMVLIAALVLGMWRRSTNGAITGA